MTVTRPKGYRGAKQVAVRRFKSAPLLQDEDVILIGVHRALTRVQDAEKRWAALAKKGATDDQVRKLIRDELGIWGSSSGPGMPQETHWGGTNPRVVVEEPGPVRGRARRKAAIVKGLELLRAARWLFKIPAPGERWRDPLDIAANGPGPWHAAKPRDALPGIPDQPGPAKKPARRRRAVREHAAPVGVIGPKKALSVEWFTPPELLVPVREVLGDPIPLDPFTHHTNPTRATVFYTVRENGLLQPWGAPSFTNPPYGKALRPALAKIAREAITWRDGHPPPPIIALLPTSRWEQAYLHDLLRAASTMCFVRKRVRFIKAKTGDRPRGNTYASMFLGFNVDPQAFEAAFRHVGLCLRISPL